MFPSDQQLVPTTLAALALPSAGVTWLGDGIVPHSAIALFSRSVQSNMETFMRRSTNTYLVPSHSPVYFSALKCSQQPHPGFTPLRSKAHRSKCSFGNIQTFTLAAKVYILSLHEKSNWDNLTRAASISLDRDETYRFWSRCISLSLQ